MITQIIDNNKLLAIIIRANFEKEGIEFFTPNEFSQQLAYMKREKDHLIQPHVHNIIERNVQYTKEVLLIKSGKVRADFYNDDQKYLKSTILNKGDIILLAFGGHGFKMLEESEIIEIKQGPYLGEMDKVRFDSIIDSEVKIEV